MKEKCINFRSRICFKNGINCTDCTYFETREEYNKRMEQAYYENRHAINW